MTMPIRATCNACGEVDLSSNDVTLTVCKEQPRLSVWRFRCPSCHTPVEKLADAHVVGLLLHAGVHAELMSLPAEALEPHLGAPICYDDLLDFGLELSRPDWLNELAG